MSKADLISLRSELERTRDNVHNDLQGVKYALYGYKDGGNIADNSNTLVVEEEGEAGGLEELLGQFNSGRIQYGLAGIKLEMGVKCVLIAWQ
ncbi:uncharacterized protein LOC111696629 isoform X2 [Eurytemora carolleeae]|nr:uncharacterized protein LOC111696629 isoform X2 [Eurytemora carolleeae]|eukprot:XP_023322064.1 uncharacterized protein LOC111696629 isoform X2 [Eurytemora affinis]